MLINTILMTGREHILQRFVYISRCILKDSVENGVIDPDVFCELKKLVDNADQLGVHGMASHGIMGITWDRHKVE